MTRELTSHKVDGLNNQLTISVEDDPGDGGANHRYDILAVDLHTARARVTELHFQNGPIGDAGVTGISNESLLAVVEDRLVGFQSGEFACLDNIKALAKVQEAMFWLHQRTRGRVARGVEGTHEK